MSITIANRPVNSIGYGMGSLSKPISEPVPMEEAIKVLKAALTAGANFWNAGEHYGTPTHNSLHVLNAYFTAYPQDADQVVVSVKSCFDWRARRARTDAAGVKQSIEHCLGIIDGKCRIDVFQAARLDPDVPVEETVGAIQEFVKAGKIGGVGLSECSATSIRRAAKVCTVAAVEVEVSLFETGIYQNGVAEACKEFGIPIVAYSPLSRGFLTGQLRTFEDLPKDDFRHMFPRFQKDAFDENVKLVEAVREIANSKDCTVIQVALAWVCAQTEVVGAPVIPIPGASTRSRMEENTRRVQLSKDDLNAISSVLAKIEIRGGRAPPQFTKWLEV